MYIAILLLIIGLCLFYNTGTRKVQYGGADAKKDDKPIVPESTKNFMKSALLAECMDPDNSDKKVMKAAKEFGIPQGTREETCQRLVDNFIKETVPD